MFKSSTFLLVFCAVAAVAVLISAASHHPIPVRGRPSHPKHTITHTHLPDGRTLTRVRRTATTPASLSSSKFAATLTNPPIEQARSMIFVISDYCNKSMTLTSQSIEDGGWVVPPPQKMCSFHECEITGFEAKVNPGQATPHVNGTWLYSMGPEPYKLNAGFFLSEGEWGMDVVSATVWRLDLMVSEYSHVAVYDIGLGNLHFDQKTWC